MGLILCRSNQQKKREEAGVSHPIGSFRREGCADRALSPGWRAV